MEAILQGEKKRQMRKEIAALQEEIEKEKELGKLVELNCRLKKLQKEWGEEG